MTVFRVGIRVRVIAVHDHSYRDALGLEGVVNELGNWGVNTVGVTLPIPDRGSGRNEDWCFMPEQLEPILDQHQPCESEFKETLDRMLEGVSA